MTAGPKEGLEAIPVDDIIDVELNITGPLWKEVIKDDWQLRHQLINKFGDLSGDEFDGKKLVGIERQRLQYANWDLHHLRPWLVGELRLKYLRENGTPRDMTLKLVNLWTGDLVHGEAISSVSGRRGRPAPLNLSQ